MACFIRFGCLQSLGKSYYFVIVLFKNIKSFLLLCFLAMPIFSGYPEDLSDSRYLWVARVADISLQENLEVRVTAYTSSSEAILRLTDIRAPKISFGKDGRITNKIDRSLISKAYPKRDIALYRVLRSDFEDDKPEKSNFYLSKPGNKVVANFGQNICQQSYVSELFLKA